MDKTELSGGVRRIGAPEDPVAVEYLNICRLHDKHLRLLFLEHFWEGPRSGPEVRLRSPAIDILVQSGQGSPLHAGRAH